MVYSQTTGVIISASQPNFPKSSYTDLEVVVLVPNHQRDTGFSPVRCYCRTSSHDYHGASSSEVELISLYRKCFFFYSNPFIHSFSLYLSASPNIHTHKLGVICMIMIRLGQHWSVSVKRKLFHLGQFVEMDENQCWNWNLSWQFKYVVDDSPLTSVKLTSVNKTLVNFCVCVCLQNTTLIDKNGGMMKVGGTTFKWARIIQTASVATSIVCFCLFRKQLASFLMNHSGLSVMKKYDFYLYNHLIWHSDKQTR